MNLDIVHLGLAIEIDLTARTIVGTCTLDLRVRTETVGSIRLDASDLEIERVSSNGLDLAFRCGTDHLDVELRVPLAPGELRSVEISYRAAPRRGLYFIGDRQVWTHNQPEDARAWFPCLDRPDVRATTDMVVTAPAALRAFSNGVRVEERTIGDRRVTHWRLDAPLPSYLVTLVIGDFVELRGAHAGVELVYLVPPGREADGHRTCRRTPEMLSLFARLFGPYPYPRYSQIFVEDFVFGGMENTTATTFAADGLIDARTALDFDLEIYIAHELVHQWFGGLVTCRSWREAWLNEAFGVYAQALWREHTEGEDAAAVERDGWSERYLLEDARRYRRSVVPPADAEPIALFDAHLYEKSGWIIHMLRRLLGDAAFFAAARLYLERNRGGTVTTAELAAAVAEATGRRIEWFLDPWLHGAGFPELELHYHWDREARVARITVEQTHGEDGAVPVFRLPLVFRFVVGGREVDHTLELSGPRAELAIPFDEEPTQSIFDPGKHVLAKARFDKQPRLWLAELGEAREGIDRVQAARALGWLDGAGDDGDRIDAALERVIADDPLWAVRAAAATALAQRSAAPADCVLAEALPREQDPRVRRALVRALGELRRPHAARTLCTVVVRGDPSAFVEAEACRALGRSGAPDALDALLGALHRSSFRELVRAAAYDGLAATGDDRVLTVLADACAADRPARARCAAIAAVAALAERRRDLASTAVQTLVPLADDRDLSVRLAVVDALKDLATVEALAAFDDITGRDRSGRLRARRPEVITQLKGPV